MPADRKPILFISSTSDLVEERKAIDSVVGRSFEVYRYEEDTAGRQAPRNRLLKILGSTDVFIGILGARYGSAYPGCESDRSIVEWEFDTARDHPTAEVFAFSKKGILDEVEPEQKRFLDRLGDFTEGLWLKEFSSVDQLKDEVSKAVMNWFARFWRASYEGSSQRSKLGPVVVFALVAMSLIAIAIAAYAGKLTMIVALGLVGVAAVIAVGGLVMASR